jgi:hypothetical protein
LILDAALSGSPRAATLGCAPTSKRTQVPVYERPTKSATCVAEGTQFVAADAGVGALPRSGATASTVVTTTAPT